MLCPWGRRRLEVRLLLQSLAATGAQGTLDGSRVEGGGRKMEVGGTRRGAEGKGCWDANIAEACGNWVGVFCVMPALTYS